MKVELRQMDEMRIATGEHRGAYHGIAETFERLGGLAGQAGLSGPDTRTLGLYYDDPESTVEADLRSEAAISVSAAAAIPEGLNEKTIRAGTYAIAVHGGSYQTLGDTWSEPMGGGLPESDYRIAGVPFECYLNTPGSVPDEELGMGIYIPLHPEWGRGRGSRRSRGNAGGRHARCGFSQGRPPLLDALDHPRRIRPRRGRD
jgi:AraC family transcriptional regulator